MAIDFCLMSVFPVKKILACCFQPAKYPASDPDTQMALPSGLDRAVVFPILPVRQDGLRGPEDFFLFEENQEGVTLRPGAKEVYISVEKFMKII